jgi:uncharacterized repeat protein (TIGR03803 family)
MNFATGRDMMGIDLKNRGIASILLSASVLMCGARTAKTQETVLYPFSATGGDAAGPVSALIFDGEGNLYGTTIRGGAHGDGAVFELSPKKGGGWTEQVIYSFGSITNDGQNPYSTPIFDGQGNLYGTTSNGGASLAGTVFELSPQQDGSWTETQLYSFKNINNDGNYPEAGVIFDGNGNLYGTTTGGGSAGSGTVFEVSPQSGGGWTEQVLHNFTSIGGDGTFPYSGLIFDKSGNLYGTTQFGGSPHGPGTVFELSPPATSGGAWTEQVIHSFRSTSSTDGVNPQAGLIFDDNGNLYGTTQWGGDHGDVYADGGTVFEMLPAAGGTWTEKVLYSFGATPTDGENPFSGLIFDDAGNLYGATEIGGDFAIGGTADGGTVFALIPNSNGNWTETILHSFGGTSADADIIRPAALLLDAGGNLYGTSTSGGAGHGTVFEISPTPAALPIFTPGAGTFAPGQTVKITDSTPGATIYFTSNGDTPTTSSTPYSKPIVLPVSQTLKAIAAASGYAQSGVATVKYVIAKPAPTPVISPASGTFALPVTVKITDAAAGAIIHYTTNGTTPTLASAKYTAALKVAADEKIEAIAIAPGSSASKVASATYVVKTAAPMFSPIAGKYTKPQSVKITDAKPKAVIYYTTNGAAPTTASKKYTAPIVVSATETVKAMAIAPGFAPSTTVSAAYTVEKPAATPVIKPDGGAVAKGTSVTVTDSTKGAVIYYTINGTVPTSKSTKYTKAFAVSANETVKAIAIATGDSASAVATAKFTIK